MKLNHVSLENITGLVAYRQTLQGEVGVSLALGAEGMGIESGVFGKTAQLTGPLISHYELWC